MIYEFLKQRTPSEIGMELAKRVQMKRKEAGLTQSALSSKSGVSFGSIKRFESKGEISLASLIKISIALECEDEFDQLFKKRQFNSIQEVIDGQD